ncbi:MULTISPECIES: carbon-nitrogen hydrolase family protein [Roseomonadaceae]|uniref:Carbon-nitrogen hydrolase family protein n=1 Tax=Falsiroseomonas oleicola TaxID=2801474 RepID=A0ABS6H436_9PROT|nr:carbon-nitrogen hydrolase family protein [Roseomonas oleicola]MBU8542291.1 carbon-nitrogen hydrolase family protein [Roseomonas oleicola]
MRVAVVQMNPGHDKSANIAQAERLIDAAVAAERPGLVALPEIWTCLGGDRATRHAAAEALPETGSPDPGGEAYEFLRGMARRHGIHLHGGSIGERGPEKLYNTTLAFGPEGRELARYRKIHLFDIVTPDGAGYRESATYGGGQAVVTYQAGPIRVGCAICYDIRFPELFLALRRAGAELILLPAAFTVPTGRDHWETLIRARAIETQCWFAAPATWGEHQERGGPRQTYGHSLIVDPWGRVVAQLPEGVGFAAADIDQAVTARLRRDMPVLEHRDAAQVSY